MDIEESVRSTARCVAEIRTEDEVMKFYLVLRYGTLVVVLACLFALAKGSFETSDRHGPPAPGGDRQVWQRAQATLEEGRRIFRYDTFGDEAYWGDALQLHKAIEGERFGGVGGGVSPNALSFDRVASLSHSEVHGGLINVRTSICSRPIALSCSMICSRM